MTVEAAIERLSEGYYNSGNASESNPGGMGNSGHRTNLPALLVDVGDVGAYSGEQAAAAAASATAADNSATAAAASETGAGNSATTASGAAATAVAARDTAVAAAASLDIPTAEIADEGKALVGGAAGGYVLTPAALGSAAFAATGTEAAEVPTNDDLGSAAYADTGTEAGQVPTNGDLGTAAYADTGTEAGEVPTNGDLGTAAYADTGTESGQVPTNGDLGEGAFLDVASQEDAEAGTGTDLMTSERTAQAIAAQAAGGVDRVARDNTTFLGFELARIDGLSKFAMVNTIIDAFTDETGVDTGTSSNEIYNAAGDYYSGASSNLVSGATGTSFSSGFVDAGGVAAAFDGTTVQSRAASASDAVSISGYNNYVGKVYSGPKTIVEARAYSPSDGAFLTSQAANLKLQYSADTTIGTDGSWNDLQTLASTSAGGQTLTFDSFVPASAVGWRLNINGNASNSAEFAEVRFYEKVVTNVTLVSAAYTAASAPDELRGILEVVEIDSVTPNTDLTMELSRTGGSEWTAVTLEEVIDGGSGRRVYAATADVSGQASGTDVRWRVKTLNTKDIQIHRVGVQADVQLSV